MYFLREFVFVLSGAFVTFLVTVTENPRQANNERNGLFLAHILRVQSIMVGKEWYLRQLDSLHPEPGRGNWPFGSIAALKEKVSRHSGYNRLHIRYLLGGNIQEGGYLGSGEKQQRTEEKIEFI